ncbi:MAG: four helix bundle protein [Gemmatimonadetes bacterium]|nr:four helix bundle protein [Gemmatimonadota bacterium]
MAEGNARGSSTEYAHFLAISKGSLMEAETYVFVAIRRAYITASAPACRLIPLFPVPCSPSLSPVSFYLRPLSSLVVRPALSGLTSSSQWGSSMARQRDSAARKLNGLRKSWL